MSSTSLKDKLRLAAQSAATVAGRLANGEDLTVSSDVFDARMQVCKACPSFKRDTEQCGECLCFLQAKARLAGMKCPLGKWPQEEKP